jgi:hypothetical protein
MDRLVVWKELAGGALLGPVELGPLPVQPAEFVRGALMRLFEEPVKIGFVVETRGATNEFYGIVRFYQQLTGMTQAHINQELRKTFVGGFFKKMTERRFAEIDSGSNVRHPQPVIVKMFDDVLICRMQPFALCVNGFPVKSLARQVAVFDRFGQDLQHL